MMEDLAMHILEILMNSIKAGASLITLKIRDSFNDDVIAFSIEDDGKGMDEEMVKKAADPFTTSRTTRRIGMGLAFMKGLAETCGGSFAIDYVLEYETDYGQFVFDTRIIKEELAGVSLLEPEILIWIKEYINQGIEQAKEDTRQ